MTLSILGATIELGLILAWIIFWAAVALVAVGLHGAAAAHEERWGHRR